jgi:hypothetical protein
MMGSYHPRFASSALDMFIDAGAPHVSTVTVLPPHGRRPWQGATDRGSRGLT